MSIVMWMRPRSILLAGTKYWGHAIQHEPACHWQLEGQCSRTFSLHNHDPGFGQHRGTLTQDPHGSGVSKPRGNRQILRFHEVVARSGEDDAVRGYIGRPWRPFDLAHGED